MPVVFSSTFSSFLTTNLNKKEAMCHQSAKKVIGRVKTFIEETKDQDLKAAFAVALQRQPGGSLNKELKGKGGAGILQVRILMLLIYVSQIRCYSLFR